ncbi:MAG: PP2C family serine/threonine-protein phosphatase [Pseudomonadota bacterium]
MTSGSVSPLFEIASCTDPGRVREANEDHCATFRDGECAGLVVADGVSSFEGGDTASRLAVEVTRDSFLAQASSLNPAKRLFRAAQQANIAVHDLALLVPELRSMATTLTAVVLVRDELFAVHIGDCRLYLYRDGQLLQLSKDHTVAAERMRLGLLSKARARSHPGRSVLTRGLGRELIARVDQISRRILERDLFVVCSDGIHGLLDDHEIARLCACGSAELLCSALIRTANERGSPDNVTAAVARVMGAPPPSTGKRGLLGIVPRMLRR